MAPPLSRVWQPPLTLPLIVWCLVGLSAAQYDPLKDFCRRFGHQSAIVDDHLYLDGGFVNWKPFSSESQNFTNPFLLFQDLNSVSDGGMPNLYANLSKNATIPNVNGGKFWEDDVNKRIYLFGGDYFNSAPAQFILYSYDILYNQWVSHGQPKGAGVINAVSYGAGVSIPSRGEAYYYGGWQSNNSIPGWTGPPQATNRLIKYTMDSNSWSNLTGPDDTRRAEGEMVFLPIGDAGWLVYFGGIQDLYGNGTITPQPMDEILIYDVANTKWYKQKASGWIPEIRRRFCGGATWAQDQSSYNIYIYGGAGFPPDTTGYDDIYILTIPSFQWIRGPYPPGSNVTGAFPKSMMSCNVVKGSQMLVIGGTYSNDTTNMCDADPVWGTHNMNLGKENPDNVIWALYQTELTTYAVPEDVLTAVGGRNTGGATMTAPTSGFDEPDLSVLATRKAQIATRTPTRPIPTETGTPPDDGGGGSGLSKGALAGIIVGAVVGAALIGLAVWFLFRHLKNKTGQAPPGDANLPSQPMEQNVSYGNQQNYQGQQWGSPTLTSHSYTPSGPPPAPVMPYSPPAELPVGAGGYQQYGDSRGVSPGQDSKYDAQMGVYQRHMSQELPVSPRDSPGGGYPSPNPSQGAYSTPTAGNETTHSFSPRNDAGWESYEVQGGTQYNQSTH